MKELDLDFGDLSDHPPPPRVSMDVFERWVFEMFAKSGRGHMSAEEIRADFRRNEGSQTEEWPDFGAACTPRCLAPPTPCDEGQSPA